MSLALYKQGYKGYRGSSFLPVCMVPQVGLYNFVFECTDLR